MRVLALALAALLFATLACSQPVLDPTDVSPIEARFVESEFTTYYTVLVSAATQRGDVRWSGTNCGTTETPEMQLETIQTPAGPAPGGEVHTFVWHHPHPPCGDTKDHRDATIRVRVETLSATSEAECTYVGSATGKGEHCKTVTKQK